MIVFCREHTHTYIHTNVYTEVGRGRRGKHVCTVPSLNTPLSLHSPSIYPPHHPNLNATPHPSYTLPLLSTPL